MAEAAPMIDLLRTERADPADPPFVPQAEAVEETGIDLALLVELALKTIYFAGRPSGRQLAEQLALSFQVTEEVITFLRREQAIEVVGSLGVGEQAYQYGLSNRGIQKAEDALSRNQYVGPAPVPYSLYLEILSSQSIQTATIDRETFAEGLAGLVLSRQVIAPLGPAVNSGRSVLIYGESGNGKTTITLAISRMLPGEVLIPYAVEVHGQIIKVYDPRLHVQAPDQLLEERRPTGGEDASTRRRDRRWMICKRPVVIVGGELTLDDLELRYSPVSKFYIAPLQWKANSGILVIDDFGRQMVQPQELLNRWIVPMEQRVDHLTFHTGDTIELPFEALLIFSTNIPPGHLGDEAFFRRIRHKIEVPNPTPSEFLQILRQVCEEKNVPYTDTGAEYLINTHYRQIGRVFKGCHPRDLLELLSDIALFYGETPVLTPEWIDLAASSYFVQVDEDAA
ncbi:MAG: ATP-binding protein [Dehalococcoidia bacterium]